MPPGRPSSSRSPVATTFPAGHSPIAPLVHAGDNGAVRGNSRRHGGHGGAGPVWTGGFAFAPDGGTSPTWSSFAPASMALPEISVCRTAGETYLTLNALAGSGAGRKGRASAEITPALVATSMVTRKVSLRVLSSAFLRCQHRVPMIDSPRQHGGLASAAGAFLAS